MKPVLGIDPGVNGGLVIVFGQTLVHVEAFRPRMTEAELVCVVQQALDYMMGQDSKHVFMEKVGYIRGDGGQGSFTFGKTVGLIRGTLLSRGYAPRDVLPMMWQAKLECLTGGNKNVSKNRAMQIWPGVKWTHATTDAALIAEYGRRVTLGL